MIEAKGNEITHIQYYLIAKGDEFSYRDYLVPPDSLNDYVHAQMRMVPANLLQLLNPNLYYRLRANTLFSSWLDISVVYGHNIGSHQYFLQHPGIKVVLIDEIAAADVKIVVDILAGQENYYYTFLKENDPNSSLAGELPAGAHFDNDLVLIESLRRDAEAIVQRLATALPEFTERLKINMEAFSTAPQVLEPLEKIPVFKGGHPNFFTLNQINGNYWLHKNAVGDYSEEFLKSMSRRSLQTREGDPDRRSAILLEQVKSIDQYWLRQAPDTRVSGIETLLNPLVMVLPFQNPQAKQLADIFGASGLPASFDAALGAEQNFNYNFEMIAKDELFPHVNETPEIAQFRAVALAITVPRLEFLDFVSYLHSSFHLSPCYRFPLSGKSIYRELAFLRPDTRNLLTGQRLNKTIRTFSKKLSVRLLTKEFDQYLAERNGQVVAITDLPVELMEVNGLPLMLTHDVCRITETNYRTPISSYMVHNKFKYVIPPDIVKKTLVILGAPLDPAFARTNALIENAAEDHGFTCRKCFSVIDFVNAIEEVKPELLIIDCHGGYDKEMLSSHLLINGEKLNEVTLREIPTPVPLVFLSACTTAPTFGYVHSVANVFLAKGTFAVTTTLLPIDILRGTTLYYRLLVSLDKAAEHGNFPNWLSFVSYITRTAAFDDIIFKLLEHTAKFTAAKKSRAEKILNNMQAIIDRTVSFERRRETFEQINRLINSLDEGLRIDFNAMVHEHLLYSHLGRADLVLFETWMERKEALLDQQAAAIRQEQYN
ncbi:MAG: hypothetical protein EOO13_00025 [Chitinophagaceae bacterium]|nr:MAG: hypothetical protein EOO13_00025 [Chitinophagaceae bacterium]